MKIMLDDTLDKIRRARMAGNTIKGVHCYDMLANPDY